MPDVDVAIVGGGPAGAALAIRLAHAGVGVTLMERSVEPHWRPCGVFSSPLALRKLSELGLAPQQIEPLVRRIAALNLRTISGSTCRLEYQHGDACGFDRVQLDRVLLDAARDAGADVRTANVVRAVDLSRAAGADVRLSVSPTQPHDAGAGARQQITARVVVGADGANSLVARTAEVTRPLSLLRKSAITFHRADPDARPVTERMDGAFVFGNGWYVGVAPVPGARVNLGMVVPRSWIGHGPARIDETLMRRFPEPESAWMTAPMCDEYKVTGVLGHRVLRAAGDGWLLVGDAWGFIDPLTGEGLHRALVSAEIAADSILRWLRGDVRALDDYDRYLRARFRAKDIVSWVLQAFLARPELLDYAIRRLASRSAQRQVFTLVLTDQVPASRGLDPRFLARLLAP